MDASQVIEAATDLSKRWIRDGFASRYAEALVQTADYLPVDAGRESRALGVLLDERAITPLLFQRPYASAEALREATEAFRKGCPSPSIFVLGSGNSGMPIIVNALIGLAAGKRVIGRASSWNAGAVAVWYEGFKSACKDLDGQLEFLTEPHDSPAYRARLGGLDVQHAFLWGGAQALRETALMLPPSVAERTFHFGPRTGVVLLECDWWRAASEQERRQVAYALYENLIVYDAALCSSPTLGVAIGEPLEVREVASELAALIVPIGDERARFERLPAANSRRSVMTRWVSCGYSLHKSQGNGAVLAVGDFEAYRRKNTLFPPAPTHFDSAGSLELVAFPREEMNTSAELVARLQAEPRYTGSLWSVGHVATAASGDTVWQWLDHASKVEPSPAPLASYGRALSAREWRVVDIRKNLERQPEDLADGVGLMAAMFK